MSAITKETANSGHYGSKNKKKGAIKSEKKGVQELHTKVKRSEGFGSIMIESAIEYVEWGVAHAHVWVFVLVFFNILREFPDFLSQQSDHDTGGLFGLSR